MDIQTRQPERRRQRLHPILERRNGFDRRARVAGMQT